ncbi:lactonase family protein [Halomonas binhaiensis]|uniref:Beta-propeller fold lactonase family protein n=1 Tax=Halomonas binhaiensis TaxID=2562282 RepID=A0A856QRK6_9GAMM|nr:beta-propeller fold lactonase family protein [Halomonas binhaiensis]QEM82509.2 beta-propeller fold lactonase family protein [Halomonas binhaiensis]
MNKLLACALVLSSFNVMAKELTGGVYVATNNAEENSIIGYKQYSDGTLSKVGEYKTGGKGTGFVELFDLPYDPTSGHTFSDGIDPLAAAYGLWRSWDGKNVLIANAGNGTVSSLRVKDDLSLELVNVVEAGDIKPNGIDSYEDLVYVVSMGKKVEDPSEGNIKGYRIDDKGHLTPIPDSLRKLTGRPASVEFTPDGKSLLVVEITTGVIHSYAVNDDGLLSDEPVSSIDSPLASPDRFFALPIGTKIIEGQGGNNTLLVTETRFIDSDHNFYNSSEEHKKEYPFLRLFEGQAGSVTSYNIDKDGKLSIISPDVIAGTSYWDGQQAVCWVTASENGKYAWTTNPLTSSISTYEVNEDGSISLLEEIAYQDSGYDEYFLDMDLSADGNYVNTISGNTGVTWVFKINHEDGSLSLVNGYGGGAYVHSYGIVTIPYEGGDQE